MLEAITAWLLNYLLHGTALMGAVWAAERAGWLRDRDWRECLWRWAFFGALLTATVQPLLQALPDSVGLTAAMTMADDVDTAPQTPTPAAAPTGALAPRDDAAPHAPPFFIPVPSPVDITRAAPDARGEWRMAVAAALIAWPLVAVAGLMLTLVRWLRLRRLVRTMPLHDDDDLRAAADRLSRSAGVAPPTLRISPHWRSPLVAPGRQICLPAGLMARLDAAQREAVLAHEVAHLSRHDIAWRLAARLVAHLGWLQPLNRLALRRLDLLAELACDAWAARQAAPLALAESLYICARDQAAPPAGTRRARRLIRMPALASAMAAVRSPLMQRMQALLEDPAMSDTAAATARFPLPRRAGRWLLAGGLCALALGVPMFVIGKAPRLDLDLGDLAAHFDLRGKVTRVTTISPDHELRVSYNGDIVFNEDDTDILRLDDKLIITERAAGVTRRVMMTMQGDDRIARQYWVDGEPHELDAAAQAWINEQIAALAESVLGSEKRALRLIERGGVALVLADAAKASQPHVRRSRIEGLLATGAQDEATITRLIALCTDIGDGVERRAVLQAIVANGVLTAVQQTAVLTSARSLDGDFEKREVLAAISPQLKDQPETLAAWLATLRKIGGDFEKRSAVVALLDQGQASAARVDVALEASLAIDGDFERRSALEAVSKELGAAAGPQAARYADAVAAMNGDFERRSALVALLQRADIDSAVGQQVLRAMEGMDSSFERTETLIALAARMPADADLIAQYRLRARGLDAHDRGRAEAALDHLTPG